MKSKTQTNKLSIEVRPQVSHDSYIAKKKVESELRSVTHRLNKAHEWVPLIKELDPKQNPMEVLSDLRKRQRKLMQELAAIEQKEADERLKKGEDKLSAIMADPLQMALYRSKVRRLRELQRVDGGDVHFSPDDEAGESWSRLIARFHLEEYPPVRWGNHEDATSSSTWSFSMDEQRDILGHEASFNRPPPGFWDINKESRRGHFLNLCAFTFDIPASPFDAIVNFKLRVSYVLQLEIRAEDALFIGSPKLFIQPDIDRNFPQGIEDFDFAGNGFWIDECETLINEPLSSTITGNYLVEAGKTSRIHIGMEWYLDLTNGMGRTVDGSDSFIIFPPSDEDTISGVRVDVVSV